MARYLQRKGVGPEVRVGLCVRRSLELLVAMLAVLKAGGAYVPLDPGYPAERLAYMMKDAGVGVLLKQGQLLEEQEVETVVDVEGDGAAIAGESKDDLGIAVWGEPGLCDVYVGIDGEAQERGGKPSQYRAAGEKPKLCGDRGRGCFSAVRADQLRCGDV